MRCFNFVEDLINQKTLKKNIKMFLQLLCERAVGVIVQVEIVEAWKRSSNLILTSQMYRDDKIGRLVQDGSRWFNC